MLHSMALVLWRVFKSATKKRNLLINTVGGMTRCSLANLQIFPWSACTVSGLHAHLFVVWPQLWSLKELKCLVGIPADKIKAYCLENKLFCKLVDWKSLQEMIAMTWFLLFLEDKIGEFSWPCFGWILMDIFGEFSWTLF